MKKKYKDMSPDERLEWQKQNPGAGKAGAFIMVAVLIGVIMLMVNMCSSDSNVSGPPVPWEKMTYEQKDSTLKTYALKHELKVPRQVEPYLNDADADVDFPLQVIVVDVDDHWCRFAGEGTAKNAFGVSMKFKYSADLYVWRDSMRWGKVDIMEGSWQ